MKKLLMILVFLAVMIICGLAILYASSLHKNPFEEKQEDLANKLGIRIEDYSYETAFPLGYFSTSLKPDMTINEVHNIVQGYDKVLHCGEYDKDAIGTNKIYYFSEIYYYFSSDDLKALRFEIFYDRQGKFERLQSEDQDSRTIRSEGCETGLIEE
jgi:hypothetical protein